MCATDASEALVLSVQHTVETMCFAEAVPAPRAMPEAFIRSTVPFRGNFAGRLDLEVDADAAQALTSALLGLRPGEIPAVPYIHDTICELGNVICGCWLSTLDPFACLQLGNTELTDFGAESALRPESRLDFQLDCGHLAVSIRLD